MNVESGESLKVAVDGLGGALVGRLKSIIELGTLALASVQKDLVDLGLKHSGGVSHKELLLEVRGLRLGPLSSSVNSFSTRGSLDNVESGSSECCVPVGGIEQIAEGRDVFIFVLGADL